MSHPTHGRDAHDRLRPEAFEPERDRDTDDAADNPDEGGHARNPGGDATDAQRHRRPEEVTPPATTIEEAATACPDGP